jgi:hypothetical protein
LQAPVYAIIFIAIIIFFIKTIPMNKVNVSRLTMYDAVVAFCNNNADTVATVPAFQTALTNFETTVSEIHDTVQMEANIISGIATDKSQLKANLCQQASDLCSIIFAYASTTSNNQLKEQVSFSFWDLKRLTDEMLIPTCSNIYNALNDNIKALKTFGITANNVSDLQSAIDDYQAVLVSPRNAITQRSAHSAVISNLFKQANDILKNQLDKMVVQFKTTAETFFVAYKKNRAIVSRGAVKAVAN